MLFDDNKKNGYHTTIMPLFSDGELDLTYDLEKCNFEDTPILASRDMVLFPGMIMPLSIGRQKSLKLISFAEKEHKYIAVFLQKSAATDDPTAEDLYEIGCLAEVVKIMDMPDGTRNVFLQGRRLCQLERLNQFEPMLAGKISLVEEEYLPKTSRRMKAIITSLREALTEIEDIWEGQVPSEISFAFKNVKDPNYMGIYLCSCLPMNTEEKQHLLEQTIVYARLMTLLSMVNTSLSYARIKRHLDLQTQAQISDMQRNHFLHQQMMAIQKELGESTQDDIAAFLKKANKKHLSEAAQEVFRRELSKLQRTPDQSPDYGVIYNYLNAMTDLPWGETTQDNLSLKHASRVLDQDHYGLEKVKERILEHLSVIKMRGDMKSPILCLFGPPGVGKTSLGRSIAKALKRKYVRISLGGLHDESEIRGHRRTYIGAMPGRIVSGLIKAGTDNPVFVLDEIDKISSDFKGDPSSALLEVLDPEQNFAFHDNYLDVDYDLSKVLFIATANSLSTIAAPLRDRMEIINLSGYIIEEKVEIGERHLLPKQKEEHGLKNEKFSIPRRTMSTIIDRYTRESGVRLLDKRLAKIMRKVAWKVANEEQIPEKLRPEDLQQYLGTPDYDADKYEGNEYAGVVTGLAWTSVGGCTLMVEAALTKGKGEKLTLTGHLGDVMKESAMLAMQWIRANADELQIQEEIFNNYNVHIHCPEGAIPKDGPSAGITMVTALASAFTQRKVRARIAMTGEITLRGRVLPIGGVKEKLLAAKRAGVTDVVLCVDNRKDVEDIKPEYLNGLSIHYVRDIHEVIDFALLPEQVKHPKKFVIPQAQPPQVNK